jgi:hypothetical protein
VHAGEVDKRSVVGAFVTIARCIASAALIMVSVIGQAAQDGRDEDHPRFLGRPRQAARALAPGSVA